jgi:steroid Delta-isomerase
MHTDHSRAAIARLVPWFESLTPQSLQQLGDFYTPGARFKDPFMSLHEPRFVVTQQLVDGPQAFLVWEFRFRFRRGDTGTQQVIRGGSHLTLDSDGRISDHRDYWDAAEELYEKLPGLGLLMRWLKRKANS